MAPAGPVYLSLPMDDMDRECPGFPLRRKIEPRLSAGKDVLQPVAEALAAAKRPLLVIGGALDQTGGWYDGIALAEKLNAAVMASPMKDDLDFRRLIPFSRVDFSAAPARSASSYKATTWWW